MVNALWHPNWFQGANKHSQYFEGWYYKLTDREQKHTVAFIPGIAMGENHEQAMSFIQVLYSKNHTNYFAHYPLESFNHKKHSLDFDLNNSHFSTRGMTVDFMDNLLEVTIKGDISFSNQVFWPRTLCSPGIMGPYSFIPLMECNHHIISLQHDLSGSITIDNQVIDFSGGKGYIEKDWGRSFPSAYLWAHSNHFANRDTSFTLSVARVPFLGRYFNGFFAVLWHRGQLYRWASYNGGQLLSLYNSASRITIRFGNKINRLIVTIYPTAGGCLKSPVHGQMSHLVRESMDSMIEVLLYEVKTSHTIWQGITRCGCLETYGEIAGLSP